MQTTLPPKPAASTWKPTVAGILDIIVGVGDLIGVLFMIGAILLLGSSAEFLGMTEADFAPLTIGALMGILVVTTAFMAVIGILALMGGIYATQRKKWGLALAGSIAAALGSTLIGVLAIIFLAMGKDEFV